MADRPRTFWEQSLAAYRSLGPTPTPAAMVAKAADLMRVAAVDTQDRCADRLRAEARRLRDLDPMGCECGHGVTADRLCELADELRRLPLEEP